jgi:ubiquinone/menaquinone biosynthesis C-methylase UbiE
MASPTFGKYLPESEESKDQYKKQLKMGIKIEEEHYDLWEFLKDKIEDVISEKEFYSKIAKSHLKEHKDYYTKLNEAGL